MQIPGLADAPLGSRLLGGENESSGRRRIRVQVLLTASLVLSNLIGAVMVGALITVVIPGPDLLTREYLFVNAVIGPVYVGLAIAVGVLWGTLRAVRGLRWAIDGKAPTRREATTALTMPWRLTQIQAVLWTGGLVVFTLSYGLIGPETIPKVAFTVALSGVTVCAFSYLFSEFALRPAAARALEAGDPRRYRLAGVTGRNLLAWLLGTGVPVIGLMLIAIFSLVRYDVDSNQLAVIILVLGAITLLFGLSLTLLGIGATVAPIRSVTRAMAKVEVGDLDGPVAVYDGTELGELQSGFNRMAEGLRERQRIQDLFGRHVGHEVAAAAIARNPELGGEERDIAVFFIDLIGSTELAATRPPREVVDLLNRFFDVVVDEVDRHAGFVNKFEGDAALAIFGAPAEIPDPAGNALAAARRIRARLLVEVPDCDAAIGVAAGTAVAGNIGARERFEYTVIGDPVNEAARLSELAKTVPGALVASDRAVAAADPWESQQWTLGDAVVLRGRAAATRLATPVGA
ncbi:adenylate/guanylate cyclase domain-containing protein [Rhodococcus spelaei]|uniref:Adenylate/guanylate cyclase domain-containing protein n=1 Tax=Rhodococcus spelaei TaxID=2546320 RepID=A0A541B4J8_9NOCA|nr:adenylate/guanylate cyclase domain-containing protein [Rhodococcus spelaei]TQF67239.1 adenylate/guanylate cyclase domain-containing protein [Rhodococcus spelaei]